MDMLVQHGSVMLEDGLRQVDLRIRDGVFREIGEHLEPRDGETVIDARERCVLPGLIDAHVHYKMCLGNVCTADNFETGSRAAACGGVTTVVDYADHLPGRTLRESLQYRRAEARGASFVDHTFHAEVGPDSHCTGRDLAELREEGVNSLKVYTIYDCGLSYEEIERVVALAEPLDMVVTVHAEDPAIVADAIAGLQSRGQTSPAFHATSRPSEAEIVAVEKLARIAGRYRTPVHIVHVSTAGAADIIADARSRGVPLTGETCPHYLLLDDTAYQRDDAQLFIMQPPLRPPGESAKLWEHLARGTFSLLTTDHCAYCENQKFSAGTFWETNGGIPGTETLFPLLHTEGVVRGRIGLESLVEMLSRNPARLFGLYPRKGVIRVGSDADLVLLDPSREAVLTRDRLHSAASYSPFEGWKLQGVPVMTILRGMVLYEDGRFRAGDPAGAFVPAG